MDDHDKNNKTPRKLAEGRRHRLLLKYLDTKDSSTFWDWRYCTGFMGHSSPLVNVLPPLAWLGLLMHTAGIPPLNFLDAFFGK